MKQQRGACEGRAAGAVGTAGYAGHEADAPAAFVWQEKLFWHCWSWLSRRMVAAEAGGGLG